MPRFFFDVRNGKDVRDLVGIELDSAAVARRSAMRYVDELLREQPDLLGRRDQWWLSVRDEDDEVVSTIRILLNGGHHHLTEQIADGARA